LLSVDPVKLCLSERAVIDVLVVFEGLVLDIDPNSANNAAQDAENQDNVEKYTV